MTYYTPTSELVAVAWLKGLDALHGFVATEVPGRAEDGTYSWSQYGFVEVSSVGGSPDLYLPVQEPVLSLDYWAVNPDSLRPPWGKANQLHQVVRAGTLDAEDTPRLLTTMPGAYNYAKVTAAWLLTDARRVKADEAGWAHYTADLQLRWKEIAR